MSEQRKNNDFDQTIQDMTKRGIVQANQADLLQPDAKMTTEQFVLWVLKSGQLFENVDCTSDYMNHAMESGLIEDFDLVNREQLIERRQVARIVHDTLRLKMHEPDEDDWTAAKELVDLYSCRTCVQHISQVYVKGIIDSEQPNLFNLTGNFTQAEAADVILKMIDGTKRNPKTSGARIDSIKLSPDQAREFLTKNQATLLLDVRSSEDYQAGHLAESISVPLESMDEKLTRLNVKKETPIILYCQRGYRSQLAADRLIEAGYKYVYTVPGLNDFQYELVD
ncbi:rhodanese-like domain-containing protein [Amphibacillus indicireducens]|uniref:Rhodanese domain-containing protein n=1 Tax=Amphibacillus indicireducens TaxID=1076330 RepID=A0ABP7VAN2_9BACI